jgi:hypothetical protein
MGREIQVTMGFRASDVLTSPVLAPSFSLASPLQLILFVVHQFIIVYYPALSRGTSFLNLFRLLEMLGPASFVVLRILDEHLFERLHTPPASLGIPGKVGTLDLTTFQGTRFGHAS